jgi:hypothetical protein
MAEQRLIDANALMKEHCEGCSADILDMCKTDPVCASMMWIVEAPTVDAEEVVHAHWEDGYAVEPETGRIIYKSIDCSACEEVFKIESHDREYWKRRLKRCFCCGAVMDGGCDGNTGSA